MATLFPNKRGFTLAADPEQILETAYDQASSYISLKNLIKKTLLSGKPFVFAWIEGSTQEYTFHEKFMRIYQIKEELLTKKNLKKAQEKNIIGKYILMGTNVGVFNEEQVMVNRAVESYGWLKDWFYSDPKYCMHMLEHAGETIVYGYSLNIRFATYKMREFVSSHGFLRAMYLKYRTGLDMYKQGLGV